MALLTSFSEDAARTKSGGRHRAESSEARARQYMDENFQRSDWLAVVVRNAKTGETIQRISTAEKIASPEFQAWLRYKNAGGLDIKFNGTPTGPIGPKAQVRTVVFTPDKFEIQMPKPPEE